MPDAVRRVIGRVGIGVRVDPNVVKARDECRRRGIAGLNGSRIDPAEGVADECRVAVSMAGKVRVKHRLAVLAEDVGVMQGNGILQNALHIEPDQRDVLDRAFGNLVKPDEPAAVGRVVVQVFSVGDDLHVIDPPLAHHDADRFFQVRFIAPRGRKQPRPRGLVIDHDRRDRLMREMKAGIAEPGGALGEGSPRAARKWHTAIEMAGNSAGQMPVVRASGVFVEFGLGGKDGPKNILAFLIMCPPRNECLA